jgi:SAM-dependent methyltransferase
MGHERIRMPPQLNGARGPNRTPTPELELLSTIHQEKEVLEGAFAAAARSRPCLSILEAGCGRRWPVDLKGIPHEVTGVDLDERALAHRRDRVGDLHHAVLGDLATVSFEPGTFDVIFCSYVLEHVRGAGRVLGNFVSWLRPGGLLIIKIPARETVTSWLTRILPFWLHVAFYRYVAERPDAGKPGHAPYPVYHDRILSLDGIRGYCRTHSLRVREEFGMDFGFHYRHLSLTGLQRLKLLAITSLITTVGALSCGLLKSRYGGLLFVMEKVESLPLRPEAAAGMGSQSRP